MPSSLLLPFCWSAFSDGGMRRYVYLLLLQKQVLRAILEQIRRWRTADAAALADKQLLGLTRHDDKWNSGTLAITAGRKNGALPELGITFPLRTCSCFPQEILARRPILCLK